MATRENPLLARFTSDRLFAVAGRILAVLLFAVGSGALARDAAPVSSRVELTPREWAWLRQHPVIRLAPDPDFRPIEYFDEAGRYQGAAADIVRLLEARLGIQITIVRLKNWDEVMEKFRLGEVDLLGAIVRTPNRERFALFTDTLVAVPGGIFTRAEMPGTLSLAKLTGKRVAVVSNYTAHDVLKHQYPNILLDVVPDVSTGLAKASLGMVDAYVENMANASFYSQEAGITNLRLAGTTDFDYRWTIGIRKDWPEIQGILNKGLAAIDEQVRRETIGRWIHIRNEWRPSRAFLYATASSILALLLIVSGLWNRSLRKAKREALANEATFKAIFQNISDPVYIADRTGRLVAANELARLELGYTGEELLRLCIADIDATMSAEKVAALLGGAPGRGTITHEAEHRRRDGTRFPVEINLRAIEYGGQPAMLGVARNITERRRAEEALRRSESLNRSMNRISRAFITSGSEAEMYGEVLCAVLDAAQSPLGVVGYVDENGALVCPSITPQRSGEGQTRQQAVVFPAPTWGESVWGSALRSGTPELSNRPSQVPGRHVPIERSLAVPLVRQGRSIGVITVANKTSDYTVEDLDALRRIGGQLSPILWARLEKEAADRALRNQAERLSLYFDRMPLGCIVWGSDRRVQTWNPAAERIFEFPASEAVSRTAEELIVSEGSRGEVAVLWERLMAGNTSVQGGGENVTRSGRRIQCRWTHTPFRDVAGNAAGVISMIEDITDQKRAEEEHRRLEEQMMHTQKLESLGVLAGGIAHDFNNILMSIIGNVDLALLHLNPESPIVGNLLTIEQAAVRAADLATQMLAYSGKGKFLVERLDVNKIVREMTHMLEVSISKKAALHYNLAAHLPAVEADATQLRQIIMNLVINASESLGDTSGAIAISTGCMDCDNTYLRDVWLDESRPEGLYVQVEVADTGSGMDRETMTRIFDPFFTTKFTGRGLGLAAVLGIVRGHKGVIKIDSEPGRGTTFKILLPACVQPAEWSHGEMASGDWKGSGVVLLVDDEETVRSIGATMLEAIGFDVVTAADGREALEVYRQRRNDIRVVLLDLTMPQMDGEQTFRELRGIDSEVRVILSSGYGEQEVTQKFRGEGLAGFLQKPYKLAALREALRAT